MDFALPMLSGAPAYDDPYTHCGSPNAKMEWKSAQLDVSYPPDLFRSLRQVNGCVSMFDLGDSDELDSQQSSVLSPQNIAFKYSRASELAIAFIQTGEQEEQFG
ncbi:hypothetical protein DFJ58DRAFT_733611 [Suillus subalutaceus]|uniref:uncharacterized protein n=1 Tax=Suillus subalutaceus TaxID=48586 RepID=UPI001B874C6F|nr:uncharacterized protein DFJ58DRAFT_733611 [Suillus subalutaceus]KAG1838794.1 hypothetical protein DFJ58DRAFT_733611 [Suillus subalutaceus]